jgi:hypothetical protein
MYSNGSNRKSIVVAVLVLAMTMVLAVMMWLERETTVRAAPSAGTNVSGPIITHTTWTLAGSPYIIDGDVTVNEGITLTIEPGVLITTANYSHLSVLGNLHAVGTISKPITFTANLSNGPWKGITFEGNRGHIKHATIESGYHHLWIKDPKPDAHFLLENTTLGERYASPVRVEAESLHVLEMVDVTFSDEDDDLIFIEIDPGSKLQQDATLLSYPGLEGYNFGDDFGALFRYTIEPTATLTISSDLDIRAGWMRVEGSLNAIGTPEAPINLSFGAYDFEGGSGHIVHTRMYSATLRVFQLNPDVGLTVENSIIAGLGTSTTRPIFVSMSALPQLYLDNVSFDNFVNRVALFNLAGEAEALVGDVTRTSEAGLGGYELDE